MMGWDYTDCFSSYSTKCPEYSDCHMTTSVRYKARHWKRLTDLATESIDGNLVLYFFQVIESLSNDVDDPYHYPIIRVLVREEFETACFFANG